MSMALEVRGVTPRAKIVLIAICNCANEYTFEGWPPRKDLARVAECSLDTVDRCVRELVDADLLAKTERERGDGRGLTSNLYRVFPMHDPSRKDAATPRRTGAERGERTDAATPAAPVRPPWPQADAATLAARVAAPKEPSREPLAIPAPLGARAAHDPELWNARLLEAKARAGKWLRGTNPVCHTYLGLRNLCEPAAGEPCDWEADVLPAIDLIAARGKYFDTWDYVGRIAVENRDKRLVGLPDPQPQSQQRAAAGGRGRASYSDTIQRVAKEMGIE